MTRLSTLLHCALLFTLLSTVAGTSIAATYAPAQNPVGEHAWWWQPQWWQEGQMAEPRNHPVEVRWSEYSNGDVDVPAMIARPKTPGRYPAVLFQHGRRGLDELLQRQVKRIAARGFVVLAPDVYAARFIEKLPIEHDYALEGDVSKGWTCCCRCRMSAPAAPACCHTPVVATWRSRWRSSTVARMTRWPASSPGIRTCRTPMHRSRCRSTATPLRLTG